MMKNAIYGSETRRVPPGRKQRSTEESYEGWSTGKEPSKAE
jgi:hypothetical protein